MILKFKISYKEMPKMNPSTWEEYFAHYHSLESENIFEINNIKTEDDLIDRGVMQKDIELSEDKSHCIITYTFDSEDNWKNFKNRDVNDFSKLRDVIPEDLIQETTSFLSSGEVYRSPSGLQLRRFEELIDHYFNIEILENSVGDLG